MKTKAKFFIIFVLLIFPLLTKAETWLNGWTFRTPILIDNSSGTATNYQVKLNLQGNSQSDPNYIDFSKIKSDASDIRITDTDKSTLLPYFIEKWDTISKTGIIWVNIPTITSQASDYYLFTASSTLRTDYGLSYPLTYEFSIPASSSGLSAYIKYGPNWGWTALTEKTSSDFFNGIDAIRFDYANNKAYLSAAFGSSTDMLYMKIVNSQGVSVGQYLKISDYYDNRHAGVTITGDDWISGATEFEVTSDMMNSKHLWFSPGIETASNRRPNWATVQSKINGGYIEPASHSRNHTALPYADYDSEIGGSKDDILNNLTMPALSRKGNTQYLYVWIAVGGQEDDTVKAKVGQYKYLANRTVLSTSDYDRYYFPYWDNERGGYTPIGYTQRMGTDSGLTSASALNAVFDTAYDQGSIYHLMFHPASVDLTAGQYADLHTTYIANRTDVWYIAFGHLFAYRMLKDRALNRVATGGQSIYMYYGNATSTAYTDFSNTFSKDSVDDGLVKYYKMDESVGSELLQNPSFETWSGSLPSNWQSISTSTGVRDVLQETTVVNSGSNAVKLTATANNATNFGISQDITTVSNGSYQISANVRFASKTAGTLYIDAYDITHSLVLGSQSLTATSSSYSKINLRFMSTSTTDVRIRLFLNSETTTGTAYFDNLSVRQSINTLTDSTAYNRTATINGASKNSTDGGIWGIKDSTTFSSGGSLNFDGKDDFIDGGIPSELNNFGTGAMSVAAWVYINGAANSWGSAIVEKSAGDFSGGATQKTGFYLAVPWEKVTSQSDVNFCTGNGPSYSCMLTTIASTSLVGKWHHIVATMDDQALAYPKMKLYIDGELRDVKARTVTGSMDATTSKLYIGKWNYAQRFFNGSIDDVRIYNKAINPQEVKALFNRVKNKTYEPAIAPAQEFIGKSKYYIGVSNMTVATSTIQYSSDPDASKELANFDIQLSQGTASTSITDSLINVDVSSSTVQGLVVLGASKPLQIGYNNRNLMKVAPSKDSVNINMVEWNNSTGYTKWKESSDTHDVSSDHTIENLTPGARYYLKIDGAVSQTLTADQDGKVTFTYSQGYSEKTFEIEPVTETTTSSSSSQSQITTVSGGRYLYFPDGGYKMTINGGNKITNSKKIKLSFNALKDITTMEISTNPQFKNSRRIPYSKEYYMDLCESAKLCPNGSYKIYSRLFNNILNVSPILSAEINLKDNYVENQSQINQSFKFNRMETYL